MAPVSADIRLPDWLAAWPLPQAPASDADCLKLAIAIARENVARGRRSVRRRWCADDVTGEVLALGVNLAEHEPAIRCCTPRWWRSRWRAGGSRSGRRDAVRLLRALHHVSRRLALGRGPPHRVVGAEGRRRGGRLQRGRRHRSSSRPQMAARGVKLRARRHAQPRAPKCCESMWRQAERSTGLTRSTAPFRKSYCFSIWRT